MVEGHGNLMHRNPSFSFSLISLPRALAKFAKHFAKCSFTFQLLSPVSQIIIGIKYDLFSSSFSTFARSTKLSIQIIRTESESSRAKVLNQFINPCPWTSVSLFINLQRNPIFRAKFLRMINESSEIIPTILLSRTFLSLSPTKGKIWVMELRALALGGNFFWFLSFKIQGMIRFEISLFEAF